MKFDQKMDEKKIKTRKTKRKWEKDNVNVLYRIS
jgi:hypothetical protein